MGTRTILFLSAYCIVQCAANQCSDSVGTCNSPARASLMQTRLFKAKALSAVEASASRTETLRAYKEYVTDLAEKYKQSYGAPDEPGRDMEEEINREGSEISKAIATILQYINAMYDDLDRWHQQDVDSSKACAPTTVVDTCEKEYLSDKEVNEIDAAIKNEQPAREKHITCRNNCEECQISDACRLYNEYRHTNQNALFEDMVSCVDPALSDEYIKTNDADQLEEMESCLRDAKVWLDPLYKLYKNCQHQGEFCPTCASTCLADQTDFENKHCQVDLKRDEHCWAFRKCYDDQHEVCAKSTCPDIEVRVQARVADNETGELIKCLLDVLKTRDVQDNDESPAGQKRIKLDACMKNTYATDLWDIDCISNGPECPEVLHPCEDRVQPCNEEFLNEEYHNAEGRNLNLEPYQELLYATSTDMIGKCTACPWIPQEWCPGRGDYADKTDAALGLN